MNRYVQVVFMRFRTSVLKLGISRNFCNFFKNTARKILIFEYLSVILLLSGVKWLQSGVKWSGGERL